MPNMNTFSVTPYMYSKITKLLKYYFYVKKLFGQSLYEFYMISKEKYLVYLKKTNAIYRILFFCISH